MVPSIKKRRNETEPMSKKRDLVRLRVGVVDIGRNQRRQDRRDVDFRKKGKEG